MTREQLVAMYGKPNTWEETGWYWAWVNKHYDVHMNDVNLFDPLEFPTITTPEEFTCRIKDCGSLGGKEWIGYFKSVDGTHEYMLVSFEPVETA